MSSLFSHRVLDGMGLPCTSLFCCCSGQFGFFLFGFWLFILALLMAHVGYLHLVRALKRCSSSSCNSWGVEQTVDGLWYRVPATLYLDGIVWWLSHCRYKSVWVVFLNTDVFRLPSSSGVTRMSRKGIDPSSLTSSQVNLIWLLYRRYKAE